MTLPFQRITDDRPWRRRCAPLLLLVAALATWHAGARGSQPASVQFIFTSDSHYGITRDSFQGRSRVGAHVVNDAMIARMNTLPGAQFPKDGGLRAGETIGAIDFVVDGGDIANREEVTATGPIQSAAVSWAQFAADYLGTLQLKGPSGTRAPVYVVPGNHDVSNAIGYPLPLSPPSDNTAMVDIYNHMMAPAAPKTASTFHYPQDRILVSHEIGGVHFVFITMWPDSAVRTWMDRDLSRVGSAVPAVVFAHDQPESEAKHFTNPNSAHDINAVDRFENLLVDPLADGTSTSAPTLVEQRALEGFLARHRNITAYFHGNANWNQFYDWTGPDHRVVLHTFRVDSPMKGAVSAHDETKLSFQVATIDTASHEMTVRECFWNPDPFHPSGPVRWGDVTTVALAPRPIDRP